MITIKRTIAILLLFGVLHGKAQNSFYYYHARKIPFTVDTKSFLIESYAINDTTALKDLLGGDVTIKQFGIVSDRYNLVNLYDKPITTPMSVAVVLLNNDLNEADYWAYIKNLQSSPKVEYISSGLLNTHSENTNISDIFYVKIQENQDISMLKAVAEKTFTTILGQDRYMPRWYILSCNKSSMSNAIDMAKYFYETGYFTAAEPNFVGNMESSCPSDPDFGQQWYLNNEGNTGSSTWANGYDINACAAWMVTTGSSNITIGNVDASITPNHPDFSSNITLWNVDDNTATNPLTNNNSPSHATECVGLMVAQQNNGIGVAGIAPGCNLLAVSINWNGATQAGELAAGIEYAYPRSDVINCSWLYPSTVEMIDDALTDALSSGRNFNGTALGTVVVFASGNYTLGSSDAPLQYPANDASSTATTYLPDILTVGAVSNICSSKQWFNQNANLHRSYSCDDGRKFTSCSGDGLDIVAPGVSIYSTQDQVSSSPSAGAYGRGEGTSYAAPQVSATAALILSLYPCLTEYQVGQFIDEAATKINTSSNAYTYGITSANPFGLWTENVGYGMLNATASLNPVVNFSYLQHDDVTDIEKKYSLNFIRSGYNVTSTIPIGYYTIDNTANVEIKATQYITFEPGFSTVLGAVMYAHIATFSNDCNNWVPTYDKAPPADILTAQVNEDSTSIVPDQITDMVISISPNPFKSSFNVSYQTMVDNEKVSVNVYDLTGRLIYEQSMSESMGYHTITVPVNSSASIYIVKACLNGNCITQKLVKYAED
jgi:hypothetical protein